MYLWFSSRDRRYLSRSGGRFDYLLSLLSTADHNQRSLSRIGEAMSNKPFKTVSFTLGQIKEMAEFLVELEKQGACWIATASMDGWDIEITGH